MQPVILVWGISYRHQSNRKNKTKD